MFDLSNKYKKECQAYAESGIQQNSLGHTELLLLFLLLTCNQCAAVNTFLGKRHWRTGYSKSNSVPEFNCCKFIIPTVLVSCRWFFFWKNLWFYFNWFERISWLDFLLRREFVFPAKVVVLSGVQTYIHIYSCTHIYAWINMNIFLYILYIYIYVYGWLIFLAAFLFSLSVLSPILYSSAFCALWLFHCPLLKIFFHVL